VEDDETGQPLPGASVRLVSGAVLEENPLIVQDPVTLADETTDTDGRVELAMPDTGTGIVTASIGLYRQCSLRVQRPAVSPLVLKLRKGESVEGRLVDVEGNPLAGISVRAVHVGLPVRAAGAVRLVGGSTGTATTDDSGSFKVDGLVGGTYRIQLLTDGWTTRAIVEHKTPPGVSVVMPASLKPQYLSTGVASDIVGYPLRSYSFQLVDANTKAPLPWIAGAAILDPKEQFVAVAPAKPQNEAGLFRGLVVVREPESRVPEEIRVVVQPQGGPLSETTPQVLVILPLETPADAARKTQNVPYEVPEGEFGRLLIRGLRPALHWENGDLQIWIRFGGHKDPLATIARPRGEMTWSLPHVPAGEVEIRVHSPFATDWVTTAVPAGAEGTVELLIPPRLGIRLRLEDENGRRLFDADRVDIIPIKAQDDLERPVTTAWQPRDVKRTALRIAHDGSIAEPFFAVRSHGTYQCIVRKRGYEDWRRTVHVLPQGISEVDVVLESTRRGQGERERGAR